MRRAEAMAGKILLVDDDRFILNPLARILGLQGYHCTMAVTASEAWQALEKEPFDLMLLDIGLPDMDGVSLCRRVRSKYRLPIMMLTAREATSDKIIGLEVGADDYIIKPFDPQEVLARIRAHLRRTQEYSTAIAQEKNVLKIGDLIIDFDARDAYRDGTALHLTTREFELLEVLAKNQGRALSRDYLFERIWGYDAELGIKTLVVSMRRLRCKVEIDTENPRYLLTVRGYGYKFAASGEV